MTSKPGYESSEYASAFASFGTVLTLPQSQLRLIKRRITHDAFDLIGLYPYSMCNSVLAINGDHDQAVLRQTGAVALSFVLSPFDATHAEQSSRDWDCMKRFKSHFVIDFETAWKKQISKKTRYYANKGQRLHEIEPIAVDADVANTFHRLYQSTVQRHSITGVQNFSIASLHRQMTTPGAFVLRASVGDKTSGMIICMINSDHANYHLVAVADEFRDQSTNHALLLAAADRCASQGVKFLNLGGGAGTATDDSDGLFRFKRKWTPLSLHTSLFGRILDRKKYRSLSQFTRTTSSTFFPSYRAPDAAFSWQPEYL